jgi:hypothetical protein
MPLQILDTWRLDALTKKAEQPRIFIHGSPAISKISKDDKTRDFPSLPRGRFGFVKAMYYLHDSLSF